jgi:phosphoglycolate phosphatase-like HAD superfamily hydrolase
MEVDAVRTVCILLRTTAVMVILANAAAAAAADALPSWNEVAAKKAIFEFVARATQPGGPDFLPAAERIAAFDNGGTLWCEYPLDIQSLFIMDRVKRLAAQHPEWKGKQPFVALLRGDFKATLAIGERALLQAIAEAHAGMTAEEFENVVKNWLTAARHPKFKRLYIEMVYQPMVELLGYLRANNFKTYVVSGAAVEVIRPFAEKVYGIPPEQIIGSAARLKFELRNGEPVLIRLPGVDFIDERESKPFAIQRIIGRRPVAAFGNSDGDLQMLQWTCAGPGARFCVYIRHDDAAREWAYERNAPIGRLDKGLNEAKAKGWTVVSMSNDWKRVFTFEMK